ncbi:NADPH-dependent FMN reductase [Nocardia aurantiaca]|uniref:NADPH-dependent FMN reductase-like domain-containing protein n=1 Tax=Nocardia aurantiaca TaxID=2675850 RepID=A0A6I3L1K4_9NOCA|nr:NAD(P)H-dependent oxidoreductase [Nocardia aurantiaca]MTE16873.1 hypothetical protein [Nocardia aurantiaca]
MTSIGVIIGSTRPGRNGGNAARCVRDLAVEYAGEAAEFELVDLAGYQLPLLDEPTHLRMADIRSQPALTLREDFVNFTEFRPQPAQAAALHGLIDELLAWSRALAPLHTPVPATVS